MVDGGGASKTAFGNNPWSNYKFKGEKDPHAVNSDIPQSQADEIEYFCRALMLVQEW